MSLRMLVGIDAWTSLAINWTAEPKRVWEIV